MSADGSHPEAPPPTPQRAAFATGRISRTRPWADDNHLLERAYIQGGSLAAKAVLPWRSVAAIQRQANILRLNAPDQSTLARQREDAKLDRVFGNRHALDQPISPREAVCIILRQAGAPMVPRAVVDRLGLPLKEAAALLHSLVESGEVITVSVGDRPGLITLRHMPAPRADEPRTRNPARHYGKRSAPSRSADQSRAVVIAALQEAPRTIQALCAITGLSDRSVLDYLRLVGAQAIGKTTIPAGNGRRQRTASVYALAGQESTDE